eukprot:Gb_25003 [translate_table: standard]
MVIHVKNMLAESQMLVGAMAFFIMLYAFAYFVFFRKYRQLERSDASSCTISLAHGPLVALIAAYDVMGSNWRLDAPNTWLERAVLEYSLAYFMVDLVHYLQFAPGNLLFIAHHLATSLVMLSCRYYVGHGALSIMSLLFVAEITSVCQNVWSLSRFAMHLQSKRAAVVYRTICLPFYLLYTIARGILAPVLACKLGRFYLSGNADWVIPRWLVLCWMSIIILGIFASMLWIAILWFQLFRYYHTSETCGQKKFKAH